MEQDSTFSPSADFQASQRPAKALDPEVMRRLSPPLLEPLDKPEADTRQRW